MTIKILLSDDHLITRDGVASMIEKEPDMTVVALAENGREAVKLSLKHLPDVIIMDINMPDLNGIEATRQIKNQHPGSKIIALSAYSDKRYITGMLKAGVSGYLLKTNAFDELLLAIKTVIRNQNYLSRKITDIVMKDYVMKLEEESDTMVSSLTNREREVLQLIAEGQSSNQISDRLCISQKTVSTHRLNIMEKLKVNSIAELTQVAIRERIISIDQ